MTAILTLVETQDGVGDLSHLSFLAFTDGFALIDNTWHQAIANEGDESVVESMTLMVRGSTQDILLFNMRALDTLLEKIVEGRNETQLSTVWLRVKMNSETNTRRAQVLSAKRSPVAIWNGEVNNPSGGFYYQETYALALERRPLWEADAVVADGYAGGGWQMTGVSAIGGTAALGYTPGGDVPARPVSILIYGDNNVADTAEAALSRIWLGYRSVRYGNPANFQASWSIRKASYMGADTAAAADASAKDGNRVNVTFATVAALSRRATIKVSDVTANAGDQRGNYIVLLRAKLSAAGGARVRLVDGMFIDATMQARARVAVSGIDWNFYELGTVQIPTPGQSHNYDASLLGSYALGIDAERVSGAPTLHLDCLVLIPINEGHLTSQYDALLVQTLDNILIEEWGSGRVMGLGVVNGVPAGSGVFKLRGGVPVYANNRIVLAAQRRAKSVIGDTNTILLNTFKRYKTARGSG